ncbi:MAG TPA: DUF5060 domain-containing protein [Candidatus Limnocylindrales bacterium]|nr:DUF5060 domain-containing protein [Candidatus Limnocylindrales bacterium]
MIRAFLLLALPIALAAQDNPCNNTPAYSPCEMTFDLAAQDAAAHPHPYADVDLKVEFRSPRNKTYELPGYWNGGNRMVVRFSPTEGGEWNYRVTANIPSLDAKEGTFTAAASDAPGFVRIANVHHFAYTERNIPHLWMGATELGFATLSDDDARAVADARGAQKFNHLRFLVLEPGAYDNPDSPNLAYFQRLDDRIRYLNQKGITADLILAGGDRALTRTFETREQRARFVHFVVARYGGMNVTWQVVQYFEDYPDARALMKEVGLTLKRLDGMQHPRTTGAHTTSAPLLDDGWENFASYGSPNDAVGSIEHQLYAVPFVNLEPGREDTGAGKAEPGDGDAASFRHHLWNATMDGQYVTYGNTGGGMKYLETPGAKAMTVWWNLISTTRHWELEPYFDVDGGRAVALEGVEYIVYMEKPGPIELTVEKHSYDAIWIDPSDGATVRRKINSEHFVSEPPDKYHDWVLHVVREGTVAGMNKSYYFESRDIEMQEVELNPEKVPFDVVKPDGPISISKPSPYEARLKAEKRALRSVMWMWTGEVSQDAQGYRVLATGQQGTFTAPARLATNYPATMLLRVYAMNSYGKVYMVSKGYDLTP